MITWKPEDIECLVGAKFVVYDQEEGIPHHEVKFALAGLHYVLTVFSTLGMVWLRLDPKNADQVLPAFECSARCNSIEVREGSYSSTAIYFCYIEGQKDDTNSHYRLVIDRLPDDRYYIWPVLGASDPPLELPTKKLV